MLFILSQCCGIADNPRTLIFNRACATRFNRLDIRVCEVEHKILVLRGTRLIDRLSIQSVPLPIRSSFHIRYVLYDLCEIIAVAVQVAICVQIECSTRHICFLDRNYHPRGYSLHAIVRSLIHLAGVIVVRTLLERFISHHWHLACVLIWGCLPVSSHCCYIQLIIVSSKFYGMPSSTSNSCVFEVHVYHALSYFSPSLARHQNHVSHLNPIIQIQLNPMRGNVWFVLLRLEISGSLLVHAVLLLCELGTWMNFLYEDVKTYLPLLN